MNHNDILSQQPSSTEEMISNDFIWGKGNTYNCKWTIPNSKLSLSRPYLTSPKYFWRMENHFKWNLSISPYGTLTLYLDDCLKSDVRPKFKLSILNNKGEKNIIYEKSPKFDVAQMDSMQFTVMELFPTFLKEDEEGNLSDGTLTLFCEVTCVNIDQKSVQFCPVKVPESRLLKDLENIFKEQNFCDIKFLVGGREFKAHKNILSGRSSVFAAMFKHEFVESKKNCVTITDVAHEVFEEILRFIYTGHSKKIESLAYELLIAADKYALERLKVICEEVLSYKLSIDNVCNFLVLADKHNANQLKVQTMAFIFNNFDNVTKTIGWNDTKTSNPHLLISILENNFKEISRA